MVIDSHMHVRGNPDGSLDTRYCDAIVEAGDLLNIDVFCVSDLSLTGDVRYEDFHASNARVLAAMARHPARIKGYCFVNSGDSKALDEISQRVGDEGFIGIKLYNQYRIDEPVVEPVIERAVAWQVPILVHAGYLTDPKAKAGQPRCSDARHFINVARRYPEAMLIEGHIGGGGDWQWTLKHLREAPSVFMDTSGSVVDEWMIDTCVQELGVERVLFGTDMTIEGGIGKVLDADLNDAQRQKVLGGNFEAIIARRAVR